MDYRVPLGKHLDPKPHHCVHRPNVVFITIRHAEAYYDGMISPPPATALHTGYNQGLTNAGAGSEVHLGIKL